MAASESLEPRHVGAVRPLRVVRRSLAARRANPTERNQRPNFQDLQALRVGVARRRRCGNSRQSQLRIAADQLLELMAVGRCSLSAAGAANCTGPWGPPAEGTERPGATSSAGLEAVAGA
jgi:hypothetical protein